MTKQPVETVNNFIFHCIPSEIEQQPTMANHSEFQAVLTRPLKGTSKGLNDYQREIQRHKTITNPKNS